MKKKLLFFVFLTVVSLSVYFVGSGFIKTSSAYVCDFSVSEDGTEITLTLGESSSAGYIRKLSARQQHGGRLYLDCYRAFGGANGSIGAKSEYSVSLSKDTEIIALFRNKDCYEPVLRKNDLGIWEKIC